MIKEYDERYNIERFYVGYFGEIKLYDENANKIKAQLVKA